MMLLGMIIFSTCTWAVFSKHFCDGIITKHFLIFAAISSMLVIMDPTNKLAALTSVLIFIGGIAYWLFKHRQHVCKIFHTIIH